MSGCGGFRLSTGQNSPEKSVSVRGPLDQAGLWLMGWCGQPQPQGGLFKLTTSMRAFIALRSRLVLMRLGDSSSCSDFPEVMDHHLELLFVWVFCHHDGNAVGEWGGGKGPCPPLVTWRQTVKKSQEHTAVRLWLMSRHQNTAMR